MAENIQRIAAKLGAVVVGSIPDVGGGAFGAARLARIVGEHRTQTAPVPITDVTMAKLIRLAEKASTSERRVGPMDVAASLLEDAVASLPEG